MTSPVQDIFHIPPVADPAERDRLYPAARCENQRVHVLSTGRTEIVKNGAYVLLGPGVVRFPIDGWAVTNVAASTAATEALRADGRWRALRAGSIVGLGAWLDVNPVTAGTLTVEIWKAVVSPTTGVRTETATGISVVLDSTHKIFRIALQAEGLTTFAAGDELFVKYASNAGFLPDGAADLSVAIEVQVDETS